LAQQSVKQRVIEAVAVLPADATIEDAMERLYFLAKIQLGLEQADAGDTLTHREAKARLASLRSPPRRANRGRRRPLGVVSRVGSLVPGVGDTTLREVIFGAYRTVVRVQTESLQVVTVHHAARLPRV